MDRGSSRLQDLPLELVVGWGSVRGVISYGVLDSKFPAAGCNRLFALESFVGGVTPWPASAEAFELLPLLKPLGDIASYRFADGGTRPSLFPDDRVRSARLQPPGESYLLVWRISTRIRREVILPCTGNGSRTRCSTRLLPAWFTGSGPRPKARRASPAWA